MLAILLSPPAARADAQWLPAEPIRLLDGRIRVSAAVTATFGSTDDETFFNYTDYERNALRTLQASLSGIWQPHERLAFLADLRSDDLDHLGAYAAYVRVRPLRGVPLDIQAGRIPPVFGAFGRRVYQSDRFLIGYPLAYQYLTSLRADAAPVTAGDLLRMRGRGWRTSFPVGSPYAGPGLPLISAFRWDTGVQAAWSSARIDAALAVTTGTLSNPRLTDDNGEKQIVGRLGVRPTTGLALGASAARGGWVARELPTAGGTPAQSALGADVEYSRDHWLLRSEIVWSRWDVPYVLAPPEGHAVAALATWIEGRYRLTPRIYVAARADRLGFSRVTGSLPGAVPTPWDAPVRRVEVGGGYFLQRNLVLRAVAQFNHRDGAREDSRTFLSGQIAWWF